MRMPKKGVCDKLCSRCEKNEQRKNVFSQSPRGAGLIVYLTLITSGQHKIYWKTVVGIPESAEREQPMD